LANSINGISLNDTPMFQTFKTGGALPFLWLMKDDRLGIVVLSK